LPLLFVQKGFPKMCNRLYVTRTRSRGFIGAQLQFFRLAMSILFATIRDFPSTAALIQFILCHTMLVLLVYMKPHHHEPTYFFDIMCHAILTI
jgi:hypothetical protein